MRTVDTIIIHCSDTPTGRNDQIEDCDKWHVDKGFKRDEIHRINFNPNLKAVGYHFWINIDGSVHTGRQAEEIGAHCSGLNSASIGICMVGNGVYTTAQWDALAELIRLLQTTYADTRIKGHCDTPTGAAQGKTCPSFDVHHWIANRFTPDAKNVC